jgi:hypothetical protein
MGSGLAPSVRPGMTIVGTYEERWNQSNSGRRSRQGVAFS